jgi:hypothetical protein
MSGSQSPKSETYVDFANGCLKLAADTPDSEMRSLLRAMAAEWLDLAEHELSKESHPVP